MSVETRQQTECPRCGEKAKAVERVTLDSLLTESAKGRLEETRFRYCGSETCPVVYLGEDGSVFEKEDLIVRVGVKETRAPRPVCYCFNHTVEEIEAEIAATGKSTVLGDIKRRMKDGCWCETKNPQGTCCLGIVSRYETAAIARQGKEAVTDADCCSATMASQVSDSPPSGRAGRLALVGGLVSAVVASACCWLPLLLVAVGVSGAAVSATFENYRPLFLTLTFGFLAVAFYLAYRPKKTSEGASCCPPRTTAIARVNRAVLWVVAAVALAFAFFPTYSGILGGGSSSSGVEGLESFPAVTLSVSGMHCEGCAPSVRKALEAVPGVVGASVDYESAKATVRMDGQSPPSKASLLAAVESVGYTATITDEKESSE